MVEGVNPVNSTTNNVNTNTNNVEDKSKVKGFVENVKNGDKKSMAVLVASGVVAAGAIGGGIFALLKSRPSAIAKKIETQTNNYYQSVSKKFNEIVDMINGKEQTLSMQEITDKARDTEKLTDGKFFFKQDAQNYMKFVAGSEEQKGIFEIYNADNLKIAEFEDGSDMVKMLGFKGNIDAYVTLDHSIQTYDKLDSMENIMKFLTIKEDGIGTNVRFQYDYKKGGKLIKAIKATVGDAAAGENVTAQLQVLCDDAGKAQYIVKGADNISDAATLSGKKVYELKDGKWNATGGKSIAITDNTSDGNKPPEVDSKATGTGEATGNGEQPNVEKAETGTSETGEKAAEQGTGTQKTPEAEVDPKATGTGEATGNGEQPKAEPEVKDKTETPKAEVETPKNLETGEKAAEKGTGATGNGEQPKAEPEVKGKTETPEAGEEAAEKGTGAQQLGDDTINQQPKLKKRRVDGHNASQQTKGGQIKTNNNGRQTKTNNKGGIFGRFFSIVSDGLSNFADKLD